eukprot:GILK01005138.1.p1 GENE.GILK01005138.1~~GILK01005138.1.p1  ORF type:complete len:350 (-),score=40.18 GILK01005138.1:144-1091(-)
MSAAYKDLMDFILELNESVKGQSAASELPISQFCKDVFAVLRVLHDWVQEIPPLQQPMRFGNKAFRTWHHRVKENAPQLVSRLLPDDLHPAVEELVPYFVDSFGNSTRIDYGTGHEANFVAFLCCLRKLNLFQTSDYPAIVLHVFFKGYLQLMRSLQTVYMLEPAGSHGVWGLDDYHFLPFLWGASQLVQHPELTPSSIHTAAVLDTYQADFMYISCIHFIRQVKSSSPFAENSPILNDISGVPSWEKVNSGLIKMYQVEVLSKLPVIQHFLFGSLLPDSWSTNPPSSSSTATSARPHPNPGRPTHPATHTSSHI